MSSFTKEDWESLVGCPGWAALKTYLMDARARLADQIIDGKIPDADLKEAIFRAQNLKDLAEMDLVTIQKFYGEPSETEPPA